MTGALVGFGSVSVTVDTLESATLADDRARLASHCPTPLTEVFKASPSSHQVVGVPIARPDLYPLA
jgi:hypothetical protein